MNLREGTDLVLAGIFSGILSCRAGTKEPALRPATEPRIEFASTAYDFDKVEVGQVVKHDFLFTNVGSATLEILDVRPGCGCTTAGNWDNKVKPGQTGIIPLQFNSANFSGSVSKQATVICNDPTQTNVLLEVRGTVWKQIDVSESMVAFSLSSESAPIESKTVRIVSNLDEPLGLSDPQCTNESFHGELKTVKEGKEFELQITAVRPSAYSFASSPITLKTSSHTTPVIEVLAYLMVQRPVTTIPLQILLLGTPLATPIHEVVTVRYIGTNSFALSEPVANSSGVNVRMKETEPGRSFNLTVDFPAGFEVSPGQKVEVTVKSNHPKYPVIRVPVFVAQSPENPTLGQGVTRAGSKALEKSSFPMSAGK